MKKIASLICGVCLLSLFSGLAFFSCKNSESIKGRIDGAWETQWEEEIKGKIDDIKVKELIVFENDEDGDDFGKFWQFFQGKADYESLKLDAKIPFAVSVGGAWKIENDNQIVLTYDLSTMETGIGEGSTNYAVIPDILQTGKWNSTILNGYSYSEDKDAADDVNSAISSFFKDRFHAVNKENKGLSSVELNGKMLTADVYFGSESKNLTFDKLNKDKYANLFRSGNGAAPAVAAVTPSQSPQMASGVNNQYEWLLTRYANPDDMIGKSQAELRIMRNYIFARHNYKFKSPDLQQYFGAFSWYQPLYSDVSRSLNKVEKANISFIQSYENGGSAPAPVVSSGGGRNYDWLSSRYASYNDLAGKSKSELRIMRNYIYARHGYKFKSKDLQQYFSRYSWYYPRYSDVSGSLNRIEKENISYIQSFE